MEECPLYDTKINQSERVPSCYPITLGTSVIDRLASHHIGQLRSNGSRRVGSVVPGLRDFAAARHALPTPLLDPAGLTPESTLAIAINSSTMMFTSISNVSVSTAATWCSSAPSTSTTTTITTDTTTTTNTAINDLIFSQEPTSTYINNTVPVGLASTPFTSTVNSILTPVMTCYQLDDILSKWNLMLEDKEIHFLYQATHINAWDHALTENDEKITILHGEVEEVKLYQKSLEKELDFVLLQQKELKSLLIPLEESLNDQSGSVYLKYADNECEELYKLAENIDTQLKQMAQDLKDITEQLNIFEKPADTTEPLQQICRILTAHMDSLNWINQNSGLLQSKIEEIAHVFQYHLEKRNVT
ncbi:nucleoporin-62 C-terminal-like protein [Rhynchonycteris naso]